jgi:hypothetical protein
LNTISGWDIGSLSFRITSIIPSSSGTFGFPLMHRNWHPYLISFYLGTTIFTTCYVFLSSSSNRIFSLK